MVLFGDSITEESFNNSGWGASLTHHFARVVPLSLCQIYFLEIMFFFCDEVVLFVFVYVFLAIVVLYSI